MEYSTEMETLRLLDIAGVIPTFAVRFTFRMGLCIVQYLQERIVMTIQVCDITIYPSGILQKGNSLERGLMKVLKV